VGARAGTDVPLLVARLPDGGSRPVLLATFDVPIVEDASSFAVDTAVETGRQLVVVNIVGGRYFPAPGVPVPYSVVHEEVEASLARPATLAASLGVRAERLRVLTPRPVKALIEVIGERSPAVVVLGADPARMPRRRYAKALRALRERTPCLLWP
jgi:hypothetical protein